MAQPSSDPFTLAGSGGVVLGEARTSHEGRNAVLLVRGQADTRELEDLAATMGISIVETVVQAGREDPRTYLGKGRLMDIVDELQSRVPGHPWGEGRLGVGPHECDGPSTRGHQFSHRSRDLGSGSLVALVVHRPCGIG
jgi:hypothetical protein